MKTTLLTQPVNSITLSHQLEEVVFRVLTNFIRLLKVTQLAVDETLCTAMNFGSGISILFFVCILHKMSPSGVQIKQSGE